LPQALENDKITSLTNKMKTATNSKTNHNDKSVLKSKTNSQPAEVITLSILGFCMLTTAIHCVCVCVCVCIYNTLHNVCGCIFENPLGMHCRATLSQGRPALQVGCCL